MSGDASPNPLRRISERIVSLGHSLQRKSTGHAAPTNEVEQEVALEDNEGKSQHDSRFNERRHELYEVC